jgi:hypothetical protein
MVHAANIDPEIYNPVMKTKKLGGHTMALGKTKRAHTP